MAGKTFRGVGDDEESSRRTDQDGTPEYDDEDDSRGVNSGPTVVDDKKVAEVLKKLRSLDRPPGPLTGVTDVVVDDNSSGQTRVDSGPIQLDSGAVRPAESGPTMKVDAGPASLQDIMYPLRATALGRSPSTPTDAQAVTVPADLARGTLFGHSIHLPDVNAPDEASIELSSGSIQFQDRTPPPAQPFPLAERPAVALPPPTAPAQRFHTPYETDPGTDRVNPRRGKLKGMLALLGSFAVVAGGFVAWKQWNVQQADANASPQVPAAAAKPSPVVGPAIVPLPSPPPSPDPAPAPAPAATAPAPPPAAPATPQPAPAAAARPAAAPTDEPTPAPAAVAEPKPTTRRAPPAPERRPAAKSVAPAEASPPATSKPVRSRRRAAAISEDPDATLPPSM